MGSEVRYIGPSGAVFVLPPGIFSEASIASRLESGEWKPFEEPEPKRVGRPRKTD